MSPTSTPDFRTHFVKIKHVQDRRAIIGLATALGVVSFAFIVCVAWFFLVLLPRREARAARRARLTRPMLRRDGGDDADADAEAEAEAEAGAVLMGERRDAPMSPEERVRSGLA